MYAQRLGGDDGPAFAVPPVPAWWAHAACRGEGVDRWFPPSGAAITAQRTTCAACPVVAECLTAGIGDDHGIHGGTTRRERVRLRRVVAQGVELADAVDAWCDALADGWHKSLAADVVQQLASTSTAADVEDADEVEAA